MSYQGAGLVEGNEPSQPTDDSSTAFLFPEPSAPCERDAMSYLANSHDGMEHEGALTGANEPDSSPALFPVAVMDLTQALRSSIPNVLYDYQRDRVLYPPPLSTVLTRDISERDKEYENTPLQRWSSENTIQSNNRTEKSNAIASGVAGAVLGTLVLGTLPGFIAGFYAAYAHGQTGAAGDVSRALGEIAMVAREKAIVIDNKHRLIARGKVAILEAWDHAKLLDREHHIVERIKDFAIFSFTTAFEFIRRNNSLIETNMNPSVAWQHNRPRSVPVSNPSEHRPPLLCNHNRH